MKQTEFDNDDYVEVLPDRPTIIETPQKQVARMLLFASEAVDEGMYEEAADVVRSVRFRIEQLIQDRRDAQSQGYSDLEKDHNNVKKHL